MAKSSPEKLAAALRANLRRRKQVSTPKPASEVVQAPDRPTVKPVEKSPKN